MIDSAFLARHGLELAFATLAVVNGLVALWALFDNLDLQREIERYKEAARSWSMYRRWVLKETKR